MYVNMCSYVGCVCKCLLTLEQLLFKTDVRNNLILNFYLYVNLLWNSLNSSAWYIFLLILKVKVTYLLKLNFFWDFLHDPNKSLSSYLWPRFLQPSFLCQPKSGLTCVSSKNKTRRSCTESIQKQFSLILFQLLHTTNIFIRRNTWTKHRFLLRLPLKL